jgi:hypothetical protein
MTNKEQSPFTPGSPVPYELFVGRISQIGEIVRYVEQASAGRQENIFLSGDRGIGKSSLASFLSHLASTQKGMLGIHVFLGGVSTLEEMVRHIIDRLLDEAQGEAWFEKITKFLGNHVKQIGLFGISVAFAPPEEGLRHLVRKFPQALANILNEVKDSKKGLFIVLDDINGLAEKAEFANWYKSFVDEVATRRTEFPVMIMLTGLPEKRDSLSNLQPSLMRIFRAVEIEKLSDEEVRDFFLAAFEKAKITVEDHALPIMVTFSSGLPILMHEIGDAVFWADTDGIISPSDAIKGIMRAAENVGRKYLAPKVYRAIRSPRYRSILRKFHETEDPMAREFVRKNLEQKLSENEKKVFHNFLKRMRDLGVIEQDMEGGPGAYRFVNDIYPIYIWMESEGLIDKRRTRQDL